MNNETTGDLEVIGEVRRGVSSVVRVSIGEFRKRIYVYCQGWEKDEQDPGEGTLRYRGLTVRPDTLRELIPLFEAAIEKAVARKGEGREARA